MLRARSAVFIAVVLGNTGAGPSLFNAGVPGDRALPARPVAEAILEQTTASGGGMRTMSASEYEDRIRASWYGQIAGTLMGFAFEHRAAAAAVVDTIPDRFKGIPVDDDWYYEMVAVRAFERFGITMTVAQLGEQWKLNNAGSWGSSEQARLLLAKGHSGTVTAEVVTIRVQQPETQPAEVFQVGDFMQYWNPDWTLLRAGVGGAGGGMSGIRGNTHLERDVLATYPRDEVRGVVLTRKATLGATPRLRVEVGADAGRAWALDVHVGNQRPLTRIVQAKSGDREWQTVEVDLTAFAGQTVTIRLIQRVLLGPEYAPGNAYWRNLRLE